MDRVLQVPGLQETGEHDLILASGQRASSTFLRSPAFVHRHTPEPAEQSHRQNKLGHSCEVLGEARARES